jgi:hypothetical protein
LHEATEAAGLLGGDPQRAQFVVGQNARAVAGLGIDPADVPQKCAG